ncbi:hypothetical protein ACIQU4_28575 [Streptomyces sp. NPDC090741]|uniref:hypothetical protein n=1 Tax=Streptomyces sp. NPDC090741 TaxID=3365967 RepID=UPI00382B4302
MQPAEARISTPDKPVTFKQTVLLLLEDGTEMFGCAHADCVYTHHTLEGVRPHLKVHKPTPPAEPTDPADMSVRDLLQLASSAEQIGAELKSTARERDRAIEDRDHWRRRAKSSERQLRTIQNALRPVATA